MNHVDLLQNFDQICEKFSKYWTPIQNCSTYIAGGKWSQKKGRIDKYQTHASIIRCV